MVARIIAHRGGADLWPENTLAAFARAIKLGVDGIEFDLQLTADNRLVIHHDLRLKRDATRRDNIYITPPTPKIAALTYDELQLYDVGRLDPTSPYAQQRPRQQPIDGQKIPEFAALCALVRQAAPPDFRLYAELKTAMDKDENAVARLAQIFVREIEKSGLAAQCHVISFDWRALAQVRTALPHIACGYTTLRFADTDTAAATHGEKLLRTIAAAGGENWFAYWRDITPETMALAQKLRLGVGAWTVNHLADKKRLEQLGADTIITDRPDIMLT